MRRIVVMALSVILALVVAIPMASGQPEPTANKSQPMEKKILGKLGAEWWIWALEEPRATNPLLGSYSYRTDEGAKKCDGSNPSGAWFLAGTIDGSKVKRKCTAPANTKIFFPIVNTFEAEAPGTRTEEEFRQIVNDRIDQALVGSTMFLTVDRQPVPVSIEKQRADTPLFTFDLPENNIFEAPPGEYEGVADGVWVLLPPLSKGRHTIRFGGDFPNIGFEQRNTYKLKVK